MPLSASTLHSLKTNRGKAFHDATLSLCLQGVFTIVARGDRPSGGFSPERGPFPGGPAAGRPEPAGTVLASPSAVPGAKIASVRYKKDWSPTAGAFRQFLSWLDEGTDSAGEKYLEMRRRLVAYFDRKNCVAPDDLADETLNRVARRLEEEGAILDTPPARYCYITAKFVFLEYLRGDKHSETSFAEMPPQAIDSVLSTPPPETGALAGKEQVFGCLEECLAKLESVDRDLILGYYQGEQRTKIDGRRGLAASLNVTVNALSIRACRIRNKLELCVRKCANEI